MLLEAPYRPADYPPFAVTVDVVVFTVSDGTFDVVLIKRKVPPFRGRSAIPGGFVGATEDLDGAARREFTEETGIADPPSGLRQFGAYGDPRRDPRMRVVSIGYWAIVPDLGEPQAGTDAADARVVAVSEALTRSRLAFDHEAILRDAVESARRSLEETTLAPRFCDEVFTIPELRRVYEAVWGVELDPGNFQRRVTAAHGFVESTGEVRRDGRGRPPELYRAGAASAIDPPLRRPRNP